jgi:hypothetical protein
MLHIDKLFSWCQDLSKRTLKTTGAARGLKRPERGKSQAAM